MEDSIGGDILSWSRCLKELVILARWGEVLSLARVKRRQNGDILARRRFSTRLVPESTATSLPKSLLRFPPTLWDI